MKKTWMNAEAEELSLEMTQNGLLPDDDFDGRMAAVIRWQVVETW